MGAIVIAPGPEPNVEMGSHHGDGNHYEEEHHCHMAAKDQRAVVQVGKDVVLARINLLSPPSLCRADRKLGIYFCLFDVIECQALYKQL